MFIQESFPNRAQHYLQQVGCQETTAALSSDISETELEIPKETISTAVLDKQSDGALRWVTLNRSGLQESKIFADEERLDLYLSQNELVDIWEVEDRREGSEKTIYKCCDPDDKLTFQGKDKLYQEIASTTDDGVFCILDFNTNERRYVQQKKGWFQCGFEEISFEQAQKTLLMRKASRERQKKSFAIGIATLAAGPLLVTSSKILRGRSEIRALLPTYTSADILQKTFTIFSTAVLTHGMSCINADPRKSFSSTLPVALFGVLLGARRVKAQVCPQLTGGYDTPGYANDVAVSGNYAYIADYDSGLQIIDVSNVTNPKLVSVYSTPDRAKGVAVSDIYAYVADDDLGGLQIIDVSNVSNPIYVGWYNTPGNPYNIALSGIYAYIADGPSGLQIIDVSNVSNPVRMGFYNTPDRAEDVAVSGDYAYVAAGSSGLQIIDVSNVTNPVRVGFYDTPDYAYGIALSGSYAFIADYLSGLQIIDVSNATNPVLAGFYDTPGYANDVVVSGIYAYIADDVLGLQIVDVSNVTNPAGVSFFDTLGSATRLVLSGSYAYVADWSSGLQIFDLSCLSNSRTTSSKAMNTTIISNTLMHTSSHTISLYLPTNRASSNPRLLKIGLGVGITGVVCLGITGTTLFYLLKRRKESADLKTSRKEENGSSGSRTYNSFELKPVKKKGHTEIGEEYYQLSTVNEREAREIYLQTGHLIVFPDGQDKFQYVIGHGHFGVIKVAQHIDDSQYVVSKKVKGEENIRASEAEANLQREASGENILPIYNTIKLEHALYHFLPLAGLGDGRVIQQQLATTTNAKLGIEILTSMAKDLITGLKTIHEKRIYHLDIKPDNLVFTKDGTGYITDFGCAKKSTTPQIPANALGDNRYFSPRRLQAWRDRSSFDGEKADLWAAGVTLLEIMKNMVPHQLFEMPGHFATRVERCTEKFFQEKFKNIKELQYPGEGSIWWVIQGLLDPYDGTRLTAEQALDAVCFKGLNKEFRAKVFEDLQKQRVAKKTRVGDEEVDLTHYEGIAQAAKKEEASPIYESKQHQQYYDLEGYGPMPSAMTGIEHYQAPPTNPVIADYC